MLIDGKPTRAARFQQWCGLSAPDITIVNSEAADRFSWQPLNELSSDHSPILIKWNQLAKTQRAQRRVRPNFQKADWNIFRARLAEYQPLLEAVTDPAIKMKTFVDSVQKEAAIAVPQKVCRKKETPWMNAELKTLIQERNRLRRDIGANRDVWVAKTREVLEKTQEDKRNTWRAHLEEVTRTKDAMKAWAVVKSLNGSARAQDWKTLVYKGREYVSDKAKASAFIQEYATVSGRKSDRSSRRAVRELRSGVRRLLGSPRQELEQAFTPEELAAALKTVKAGKTGGPDDVAPDLLKHLPLSTQKELLFILNASWTTGWCPQAWPTATIVPFVKKEKDPQAVSSYRPIALTSTIGKLVERLIVNRLSWWLEAKSLLSPWQAGCQLAATLAAIEDTGPTDIQVYTDGSTHEGTTDGGAGMVAMSGEDIIERWHAPTGRWSSSYQAEKSAMVRAISWLDEYEDWQSALVLCDSKSLVETLANSDQPDGDMHRIQSSIAELCKKKEVRILWVPGHCNLRGNELADLEAKLGSEVAQPSVPLDSSTRAALIRQEERQSSLTHPRLTALYTTRLREEEEAFLQKADLTDLIRFRCGHHPHLRRWQHMTGMSEKDSCRLCA